jgi:pyruvate/2-oxoglutarate dehydrogenase complex dihydrolipoamide dehydrogenase (E3) component
LYKQFLRYVQDNTNKKQSNRGIFRELADKITISLTDGKFDGIIKKYNDELMEISRKMYVDASENTAKFTDNRTVTSRSTKILPLSETEKMKRVNNLLINAGANSRLTSQGA